MTRMMLWIAVFLFSIGCESRAQQERKLEAMKFGFAYHEKYAVSFGNVDWESMRDVAEQFPSLAKKIEDGAFVVNWGANLHSQGEWEKAVFAFDRDFAEKGGLVVFGDGRVRVVSRREAKKLAVAQPGELKPKKLELEVAPEYYLTQLPYLELARPTHGDRLEGDVDGWTWKNDGMPDDTLVIRYLATDMQVVLAQMRYAASRQPYSDMQQYEIESPSFSGTLVEYGCKVEPNIHLMVRDMVVSDGKMSIRITATAVKDSPRQAVFERCMRTVKWTPKFSSL